MATGVAADILVTSQLAGAGQEPAGSARLGKLAQFSGTPEQFWPAYLDALRSAFDARRAVLLVRHSGLPWQALLQSPRDTAFLPADAPRVLRLADRAMTASPLLDSDSTGAGLLAVRLPDSPVSAESDAVVGIWLDADIELSASFLLLLGELAAGVPAHYLARRQRADPQVQQAGAHRLHDILRLNIRLGQETHFMRLAFALCNELAVRFSCDRVSLGWEVDGYIELVAISHIEKFDRKATASRDLALAMEEACDQEVPVVFPPPAGTRSVCRAHEHYVHAHAAGSLMSLPLASGGKVIAVIGVERRAGALDDNAVWELSLIAAACARPLHDLRWRDRSLAERVRDTLCHWQRELLTPRHSAWKLGGGALAGILILLAVFPWDYRVDAGVTLRTKDLLFMPAPFDGYLSKVNVDVGDHVDAGQVLVELDTRDLLQEESMAAAEVARYGREAEKAQAVRELAEMQIALARQRQSEAHLTLVRHQLAHAQVRAPSPGIVVEGELRKNLGSPLRKGDLLLKLAGNSAIYLELAIDQVDVHEVSPDMAGEVALVGRPEQKFPFVVERIDPVATARDGKNVFLARATLKAAEQPWWRPGMGGNARIEVGERRLLWVLTHRTVRFLREFFWL